MTIYPEAGKIKEIIASAKTLVIVQPDNPDADSLASSLALEQILHALDKEPILYCGVDIPSYLKFLPGADRVINQLPKQFDGSIIVDTASVSLLEKLKTSGEMSWLAARPVVVLDHHATEPTITFASVVCIHKAVATAEVIFELAKQLDFPLNQTAMELLAVAILSDSLGLTSEGTTARSIHIIAELVEGGVSLAALESARRETMRREQELVHYKGRLLQRVEFPGEGRVATLTIPWEEIEKYSPLYNPPMLVLDDMRLAKGVDMAICFKQYPGGKITAKIRSNYGFGVAGKLAEHFGGGGHPYAAGFKITDDKDPEQVKREAIDVAEKLLSEVSATESS